MSFNSNLNVGIELEYPRVPDDPDLDPMIHGATKSEDLYDRIEDDCPWRGTHTFDGTVGLETVSDVLPIEEGVGWYRNALGHIANYGERFAPTSLLNRDGEGNADRNGTAGLHIHVSSLTDGEARDLYELSHHSDVQVMACSGVVENDAPDYMVFRDSWCQMDRFDSGRDCAVNGRGGGHYEWRLPEPQTAGCVGNLLEFLDTLKTRGKEGALDFAKDVVDAGDTTSIERAKKIGVSELEVGVVNSEFEAVRDPHVGTEEFFREVKWDSGAPHIYKVKGPKWSYYGIHTENDSSVEVDGRRVDDDFYVYADSLEDVEDEEVQRKIDNAIAELRTEGSAKAKNRLNQVI